ncbi:O-antigen ligase family protein [Paenibacillus terrigena]|uniref:O-antigen ligase family protein n=1 Tax=Paenibacillus terrigena TaxID=369333 RepID=UPI000379B5B1|nr:O-antigen ligase family protein [Paenibacillus terrigena]
MSNPTYGKKSSTPKSIIGLQQQENPLIYWILMGVFVLFLLWSPLWAALFNGQQIAFERPLYEAVRWVSIIMLVLGIYLFKNWKPKDLKDWYAILIFALPLTYLISLIPAASHYQALNMVYIYLIYAVIFVIGLYFTRKTRDNSIIQNTLLVSTYFTVFFGLFHWFGNSKFIAAALGWLIPLKSPTGTYLDAVMIDSNGLRLTSFFQYANTYAAFLIAILFAAAFLLVKSRKWYVSAIHAFMLVPIILSFFLTLSRAAYVILPVVFLIVILCLKPYRQIMYTVHVALAFIASMAILNKVTTIGIAVNGQFNGSESLKGWMLTLGVSILVAIIATLLQHFVTPWLQQKLNSFGQRKASSLVMPAAAVILGLAMVLIFIGTSAKNLLPENVKIRLENINFQQHSVLERATFYKDAMKLVADYPVFGAGGGAWYSMYEKYQHNPYTSRQAHSFFFQNIVEVGIVGFLVLVGLLILFFYTYIRNYVKSDEASRDSHFYYFIIAIALLIHSILDFDISYVYVGVLLFLCLGAMLSNIQPKESKKMKNVQAIKWAYPSLISVLAIVMFIFAQMSLSANASFMKSLDMVQQQTSKDYNEIVTPINKALGLRENPDYAQLKVQLLQSVYSQNQNQQFYDEAQNLLVKTLAKEPYNFQLISLQMNQYELLGDKKNLLKLVEDQLTNFPWNMSLYEKVIQLNTELESYDAALGAYQKILDQKQVLASLPKEQLQGRAFDITPKINLNVAQIYFNQADYAKAATFIKPLLTADYNDPVNRDMARWYIVSLQKQGTTDQSVYDALIATDASEKEVLAAIAASAK